MKNYFKLQGVAPRHETITETRESEHPAAKLLNSRKFLHVPPKNPPAAARAEIRPVTSTQ
jgi:hypothetical protein